VAEIFLTRPSHDLTLVPTTELSEKRVSRLTIGEDVRAEMKHGREVWRHKKFFALLWLVFNNQDKYKIFEDFLVEIKIKTGHYQEHISLERGIVYIPKSISFAKCDETTFIEIYDKALDVCLEFVNMNKFDLDAKVNEELNLRILDFT